MDAERANPYVRVVSPCWGLAWLSSCSIGRSPDSVHEPEHLEPQLKGVQPPPEASQPSIPQMSPEQTIEQTTHSAWIDSGSLSFPVLGTTARRAEERFTARPCSSTLTTTSASCLHPQERQQFMNGLGGAVLSAGGRARGHHGSRSTAIATPPGYCAE